MEFQMMRMMGRCSNGAERDSGTFVHLLTPGTFKAVCGKQPGRRSAGWALVENTVPAWAKMCPRYEKYQQELEK
ncbi:MAG: hypothetical protein ABI380_15300 [Edaphobacter sp.]